MLPKVKNFIYYWLPLIIYCLLIYIQSDYPSPESLPSFKFSDKLLHFAAYAVMGVLFYRAYQTLPVKNNIQLLMLLSMISASLYGISDEIHQSFVPYRDGSLFDGIADILGAVCGVYLYHLMTMARENRRQRYWKAEVGMRKPEK
ncbi:MAG: VanZ family protein [Desulfobacterales bacterium]|nr:MAG: VanZ family protein [Desulfobacterales bacterium]